MVHWEWAGKTPGSPAVSATAPARRQTMGVSGGAGGIRTLERLLTVTHFPGVRLRPLGHRSVAGTYSWRSGGHKSCGPMHTGISSLSLWRALRRRDLGV